MDVLGWANDDQRELINPSTVRGKKRNKLSRTNMSSPRACIFPTASCPSSPPQTHFSRGTQGGPSRTLLKNELGHFKGDDSSPMQMFLPPKFALHFWFSWNTPRALPSLNQTPPSLPGFSFGGPPPRASFTQTRRELLTQVAQLPAQQVSLRLSEICMPACWPGERSRGFCFFSPDARERDWEFGASQNRNWTPVGVCVCVLLFF